MYKLCKGGAHARFVDSFAIHVATKRAHMSSATWCFDAIEVRNGIIFDFYIHARTVTCTNFATNSERLQTGVTMTFQSGFSKAKDIYAKYGLDSMLL